jgi:hypothetical protein
MKAKVHDASFSCAMDKVTRHAESAVLNVSQTFVKNARRTGAWDSNSHEKARDIAREHVRKLVGPGGWKELRGCLGQSDEGVGTVVDAALEGALAKLKAARIIQPPSEVATKTDAPIP